MRLWKLCYVSLPPQHLANKGDCMQCACVSRLARQGHHTFPRSFSSSVPSLSELLYRYMRHVLFSRTNMSFLVVGEA